MVRALALLVALASTGCIDAVPTVAVNAGNAAQVQACQTNASVHNWFVLGGVAVGAGASGLSTVSAADPALRSSVPLLIIAASLTGLGTVATMGAGLAAASFASGGCPTVVGALPAAVAADAGS
jgi:hypothetical protein